MKTFDIFSNSNGLSQKAQHTAILAETLYKEQNLTTTQICEQLNIARSTLYTYLKYRGVSIGNTLVKV